MGILTKDLLETRLHVKRSRNLFIDVSESHNKKYALNKQEYSILNYPRIVKEMYAFIDGYIKCKASGNYKYKDNTFGTTIQFYNNMFIDEKYRKKIHLNEMDSLMKEFLEWTDKLQDLMDKHMNELGIDTEMNTMFQLTNNQYRKLAKVNRDDMEIFLWLVYKTEVNANAHDIPGTLRAAFMDENTPVMHEIKSR